MGRSGDRQETANASTNGSCSQSTSSRSWASLRPFASFTLPPRVSRGGVGHAPLRAVEAYRRQDWAEAQRLLDNAPLARAGYLMPVYELYRRRIIHFQREGTPANWHGVFIADEK
jgi:hypothetical protein